MDFIAATLNDPIKQGIIALAMGAGGIHGGFAFLSLKQQLGLLDGVMVGIAIVSSVGTTSFGAWRIYDIIAKKNQRQNRAGN